jgi:lipoic acid synthetase
MLERQDVAWKHRPADLSAFSRGEGAGDVVRDHGVTPTRAMQRLEQAGVPAGLSIATRKPEWLRPKVHHGPEVLSLKRTIRDLGLVTVCEEAGCPNLSDCWSDGTATFMVLGERCTRACGFCLVDTQRPMAPAADEPERVAESATAARRRASRR